MLELTGRPMTSNSETSSHKVKLMGGYPHGIVCQCPLEQQSTD